MSFQLTCQPYMTAHPSARLYQRAIGWQNDGNHPVATEDCPLSIRPTSRLGCIAWFCPRSGAAGKRRFSRCSGYSSSGDHRCQIQVRLPVNEGLRSWSAHLPTIIPKLNDVPSPTQFCFGSLPISGPIVQSAMHVSQPSSSGATRSKHQPVINRQSFGMVDRAPASTIHPQTQPRTMSFQLSFQPYMTAHQHRPSIRNHSKADVVPAHLPTVHDRAPFRTSLPKSDWVAERWQSPGRDGRLSIINSPDFATRVHCLVLPPQWGRT